MFPMSINPLEMYEVGDDFLTLDTVKWTSVDNGSTGTNLNDAVSGGEIAIVTAATTNDYHFLKSAAQSFLPKSKKPIWFVARVVAGTSANMWYAGLSSNVASTLVTDTSGVLVNTFSGSMFYKLPATLALGFCTSNGTTQTKNASLITTVAGQTYQLGCHWDSGDGTTAQVTPWVYDETAGLKYVGAAQPVAIASLAQMGVIFGAKSTAGAAETLKVDYIRCAQKR